LKIFVVASAVFLNPLILGMVSLRTPALFNKNQALREHFSEKAKGKVNLLLRQNQNIKTKDSSYKVQFLGVMQKKCNYMVRIVPLSLYIRKKTENRYFT
jgi:hypothetical protein